MTFAQVFTTYCSLNLMIVAAFMLLRITNIHELKIHYTTLIAIVFMTALHPLLPQGDFFKPPAKVWAANSIKSFTKEYHESNANGFISVPDIGAKATADAISRSWAIGFLLLLSVSIFLCVKDLLNLFKIRRTSYTLRKIGRVFIYINDNIRVPFSYWHPYHANVVVPSLLLTRGRDLKIALLHELQHHRNRDTIWVYILWIFRGICAVNPFVYLWTKWISELQEFTCDEILIQKNKVHVKDYARCLVEVAQTAIGQKFGPACATGLTFLTEGTLLKRRIEFMLRSQSGKASVKLKVKIATAMLVILSFAALSAKGLVEDRHITLSQAQELAMKAQRGSEIPIIVNNFVLEELNRYLGTPEGREFLKGAVSRMESYKPIIEQYLNSNNVPAEILALPIVESGYRNLTEEESNTGAKSAGLWQFIPRTARNFGLRVDKEVDERLDVPLASDASMRLLLANKIRFKDWWLSIMAYNMGSTAVQKGIDETGSRDAWTLIRAGHEGDRNYLAKFMAAMIILKNPEVL